MNNRVAISAWVRCWPSSSKTSRSRGETSGSSTPNSVRPGGRIRGYYGCAGAPATATLLGNQPTEQEAVMGSAQVQGELWGRFPQVWSATMEQSMRPLYVAALGALEPLTGASFLDAGCGAGQALADAAARGARVTGVDASAGLLEVAQARTPDADLRVGEIQ